MSSTKTTRKQEILEALATMLEQSPGSRITTAALAKHVGVSEAALYRHFPSKSKMFEGLIEFIESTLFTQFNLILDNETNAFARCGKILSLMVIFCERNPGITRLLTGDALTGETDRLHQRISQLFDRVETQLRQVLRDGELREGLKLTLSVNETCNLLLASAEGLIAKFVRSQFKQAPSQNWQQQWPYLIAGLKAE